MRKRWHKKQSNSTEQYRRLEHLSEGLGLPQDVSCGIVIVTVTGRRSLVLENYKGIVSYEDDCIRIRTKDCIVAVSGTRLKVDYYTNEEMKIVGQICQICYEVC